METLTSFGNKVLPVGEGFLASGLEGKGRMLEPETIATHLIDFFNPNLPLNNKKILITAGPTYEPIDAVRFIGNFSSGKMGFSLAKTAANLGAEVVLITGPTSLNITDANITVINIVSADEMFLEVVKHFRSSDISILSSAVSDFKPKKRSKVKIKKKEWKFAFNRFS
jgi:phosphopantothenoylcysteine decarboxylase/phosphopantothenate--cysteine ligase